MSGSLDFAPGNATQSLEARLDRLDATHFAERLWRHDSSLWGEDPSRQKVAANRLGWLDSPALMKSRIAELEGFADEVAREGFTHAVLLGMGGSSLAPDVLRQTFGVREGALELAVLDNTSPRAVRAVAAQHDPSRTLFLVSSKSGGTIEVASFEKYFFEWVRGARASQAGRAFVAVTDPGTVLEKLAAERGYRRVFSNPPDIGGRFSALSYFGLVPAALIGADLGGLLDHALVEAAVSRDRAARGIAGLRLGAALGELAQSGRNKVTLVLGPEIAAFGSWAEQLIAESTGKDGKGLVPVADEPLGPPSVYGSDRVFVALSTGFDAATAKALDRLRDAGHPVLRWTLDSRAALGGEFLRWEIATACVGTILGVDPFDEPNVSEAKQATQSVLASYLADGRFPPETPVAQSGGLQAFAPAKIADLLRGRLETRSDPASWAAALLALAQAQDYFAVLAYLHRTPECHARLERLRVAARGATRLAGTLGYGPRFLHSTGQLHKGGPNTGLFLQLTADEGEDVAIPGERYGFAALRRAQAAGDFQVLERRGRRVLRVHLGTEIERGLDSLLEAFAAARV